MTIPGNKLGEYIEEMVYVDQLWRQRFGTPLPHDYNHQKDFQLLEMDMPELPKGGLILII